MLNPFYWIIHLLVCIIFSIYWEKWIFLRPCLRKFWENLTKMGQVIFQKISLFFLSYLCVHENLLFFLFPARCNLRILDSEENIWQQISRLGFWIHCLEAQIAGIDLKLGPSEIKVFEKPWKFFTNIIKKIVNSKKCYSPSKNWKHLAVASILEFKIWPSMLESYDQWMNR
jgi:hypothetical protein